MATLSELSPAQKSLRRDFVLSFKHSQGSETLQHDLYVVLQRYYRQRHLVPPAEQIDTIAEWLPPENVPDHHDVNPDGVAVALRLEASYLKSHFIKPDTIRRKSLDTYILNELLQREIKFQTVSTRQVGVDPYGSYFRKHVVLGLPTGSPAYDNMYASLASRQPYHEEQQQKLDQLAAYWSDNHAGEPFYPVT
ncbi:MAG TPA: hypothetical protein VGE30_02345 [Candidatus Saccharimonadales bacterium]